MKLPASLEKKRDEFRLECAKSGPTFSELRRETNAFEAGCKAALTSPEVLALVLELKSFVVAWEECDGETSAGVYLDSKRFREAREHLAAFKEWSTDQGSGA